MVKIALLAALFALPASELRAFGSATIDRSKIQKKSHRLVSSSGNPVGQDGAAAGAAAAATSNANTAGTQTQLPAGVAPPTGGVLGGPGSSQSSGGNFSSPVFGNNFGLSGNSGGSTFGGTAKKQCAQGQSLVGNECVGATGINSLGGYGGSGGSGSSGSAPASSGAGAATAPPPGVPTR